MRWSSEVKFLSWPMRMLPLGAHQDPKRGGGIDQSAEHSELRAETATAISSGQDCRSAVDCR